MYKMSNVTKKNLEKSLGISLKELNKMSADEEQAWVEEKIGKKIAFCKTRRHGIVGRGNPLLARRKLRTKEDIDLKSKKMFGI